MEHGSNCADSLLSLKVKVRILWHRVCLHFIAGGLCRQYRRSLYPVTQQQRTFRNEFWDTHDWTTCNTFTAYVVDDTLTAYIVDPIYYKFPFYYKFLAICLIKQSLKCNISIDEI